MDKKKDMPAEEKPKEDDSINSQTEQSTLQLSPRAPRYVPSTSSSWTRPIELNQCETTQKKSPFHVTLDTAASTFTDQAAAHQSRILRINEGASTSSGKRHLADSTRSFFSRPLKNNITHSQQFGFSLKDAEQQKEDIFLVFQTIDGVKTEIAVNKNKIIYDAMLAFSAIRGLPLNILIFEFDGEEISGSETPQRLDLDDGVLIDVKVRALQKMSFHA